VSKVEDESQFVASVSSQAAVPALIDWNRISSWLVRCINQHSDCKNSYTKPDLKKTPLHEFRVIDVQKRQVVRPRQDDPYVALSYVWGDNPDESRSMAKLSTINIYEKEGGLAVLNMPLVIEEAMMVCIKLNQKYLWVDRLCIVQDDLL